MGVGVELHQTCVEMQQFEDVIAQHKFRASSAKWSHLADKVNADFFCANKFGCTENVMRQLEREDGSLTLDDVEMRRIASDFYKSLITRQSFTHEQLALRLNALWCVMKKKVNLSMANELFKPFNVHQVYVAIEALGKHVCLGIDGFPSEFFLCYWDHIRISVTEALQEVFALGDMPYQWNAGGFCFLFPKWRG